jgi:preprotein translocase subunit SecG
MWSLGSSPNGRGLLLDCHTLSRVAGNLNKLDSKLTRNSLHIETALGKIILWVVVFFLVLLALRMLSIHKAKRDAREAREDDAAAAKKSGRDTTPASDQMVRCASCGVYIPKANAVLGKSGPTCGNLQCDQLTKK